MYAVGIGSSCRYSVVISTGFDARTLRPLRDFPCKAGWTSGPNLAVGNDNSSTAYYSQMCNSSQALSNTGKGTYLDLEDTKVTTGLQIVAEMNLPFQMPDIRTLGNTFHRNPPLSASDLMLN